MSQGVAESNDGDMKVSGRRCRDCAQGRATVGARWRGCTTLVDSERGVDLRVGWWRKVESM